jgi:hypothetical protein
MSNLQKFNSTQWYLYVNQSKNATAGLDDGTYTYYTWAKDTSNNEAASETRTMTITSSADTTSPTFSNAGHNSTVAGAFTRFSVLWNDETALHPNGVYIFSTNNSGTWVNDTAVSFSTTPSWANVTKTLTGSAGASVGYMWYANDSAGNWNVTGIRTFQTIGNPQGNKFDIKNNTGSTVASIDSVGNMYIRGVVTESQSTLNPPANSFVVQNNTGSTVAYINNAGSLFLRGVISTYSDLLGRTTTNLEIRNASDSLVAFFDNAGNLKIKGDIAQSYPNP